MKAFFAIFLIISFRVVSGAEKDSTKFNSILVGTEYSSKTSSFGRFSSITKQPSYSGFASLYLKNGLNFSTSSLAIDNSDSTATNFTYEYDLNLGYDLSLGKYLIASANYTHFFYSENSNLLKSLYNHNISMGISYNKGKLYANLGGDYLKGNYNEWMNSANLGLNFEIKNVFFKDHSISISPVAGIIMANHKYYNQYAYQNYRYLFRLANRFPNMTIQDLYDSPSNYQFLLQQLLKAPRVLKNFRELDKDLVISDLFKAKNKYGLSSVSVVLPVYYNIGNLSLNISYSVTFPVNLPEYMDNSPVGYFSAGIYYSFIL